MSFLKVEDVVKRYQVKSHLHSPILGSRVSPELQETKRVMPRFLGALNTMDQLYQIQMLNLDLSGALDDLCKKEEEKVRYYTNRWGKEDLEEVLRAENLGALFPLSATSTGLSASSTLIRSSLVTANLERLRGLDEVVGICECVLGRIQRLTPADEPVILAQLAFLAVLHLTLLSLTLLPLLLLFPPSRFAPIVGVAVLSLPSLTSNPSSPFIPLTLLSLPLTLLSPPSPSPPRVGVGDAAGGRDEKQGGPADAAEPGGAPLLPPLPRGHRHYVTPTRGPSLVLIQLNFKLKSTDEEGLRIWSLLTDLVQHILSLPLELTQSTIPLVHFMVSELAKN